MMITPEYKREWQRRNRKKVALYQRRYRAAHPGKSRMWNRKAALKRLYKLTPADYDRLLELQGGVCALCQKPPFNGWRLFVDHNHKENRVRGLICRNCNTTLAAWGDDMSAVHRLMNYLTQNAPAGYSHGSVEPAAGNGAAHDLPAGGM